MKIILTIALCITISEPILSQNSIKKFDTGNVYIEVLTKRFLDLESALWKEIQQNAYRDDKSFILRKIHTEFLRFLSRPFIATETSVDKVKIFDQNLLESEIFDAERTVTSVKNHVLQREVDRSLDQMVIGTARSYNASLLGHIYHISVDMNYFALIKEVMTMMKYHHPLSWPITMLIFCIRNQSM